MKKKYISKATAFIIFHSFLDVLFFYYCKSAGQVFDEIEKNISLTASYNLSCLVIVALTFFVFPVKGQCFSKNLDIIKKKWAFYLWLSIFSCVGFISIFTTLSLSNLHSTIFLKHLEQIIWIFVGFFLFKETFSLNQIAGSIIVFLGIAIFVSEKVSSTENLSLVFLPVFAASCWTVSSSISRKLSTHGINSRFHLLFYYLFHTLVMIVLCLFYKATSFTFSYPIVLASCVHCFSMFLLFKSLSLEPISYLAPFVYTKIIFSTIFDIFFNKIVVSNVVMLAIVFIIIGLLNVIADRIRKGNGKRYEN